MENNNIDFNSKTEAAIESPVLCETGEPAYAICHHSGQYISEEQFRAARHSPENFYLSRHEFPGFESLDKKFQQAAHAPEYNHLEWNSFILRGIAMLGSAFLLVVGLIPVLNKGDFVADTLQEIAISEYYLPCWDLQVSPCVFLASGLFCKKQRPITPRPEKSTRPPRLLIFLCWTVNTRYKPKKKSKPISATQKEQR